MKKQYVLTALLISCLALGMTACGTTSSADDPAITPDPSESTVPPATDTDKTDDATDPVVTPYTVTFTAEHASVYIYQTQDYTAEAALTNVAYARDSETGDILSDGNGQVNFKVVCEDGFTLNNILIDGTYKNLKAPDETLAENVYRITKIGSDLSVTIETKTTEAEPDPATDAYAVTFVGEHCKVIVYDTQDYTVAGTETTVAYSRVGETGDYTKTDGQVNFKIVCDEGYTVDTVVVTGTYKNLKTPEDTSAENVYRITKIGSDLLVTITVKAV